MISLRRLTIPLALVLVGATTTVAAADEPKAVASCDQKVQPGSFTCFAMRRADLGFRSRAAGPAGFGPADLQAAYKLPSASAGRGQRVYIVDAYDDPTAEADLAVYRKQFGLPPCTTANGCFQKLNQNGKPNPLPAPSPSWSGEISLDLDMVSAVCPQCAITLIEADSPSNDLLTATKTAEQLGAKFVSLSWGGPEPTNAAKADQEYFAPRGTLYAVSTGDSDFEAGTSYPASSAAATAIGGTSLTKDASARGWSETVWNSEPGHGTGSGCSAQIAKPSWQSDIPSTVCAKRAVADISAVADPDTGVAVYQTTGGSGWGVYGGTSAAAPIVAAAYALAGDPAPATHPASYPYGKPAQLNDVVKGNNGSCDAAALCTAQPGWDGPTGLGTPNGLQALTSPIASNKIALTAPTQQFGAVGDVVLLRVKANSGALRFTTTDLPAGLHIQASTGVIYGRLTTPHTHSTTVTAVDQTGARANTVINWVVSSHRDPVVNGDFEAGVGGWTQTADVIREDGQYSKAGLGYAFLGGYTEAHTDTLSQAVTIPATAHPTLRFALRIHPAAKDALSLTVDGKVIRTISATQAKPSYADQSVDLTPYRGRTVTLAWTSSGASTFLLDNVTLR
ncbi:putative Ig domain-containing protein [Kribbella sp. NPDC051587]|uniref:putative Ig domain-containing protein n=1 Tax=Kribbella sp. NPDC051587 TaxID=3364119 RepID=UPI0037B4F1D8